jgi:hypothetical protein
MDRHIERPGLFEDWYSCQSVELSRLCLACLAERASQSRQMSCLS